MLFVGWGEGVAGALLLYFWVWTEHFGGCLVI